MKKEMNQDQFAEFIAKIIFKIDFYQFDILYDVSRIMSELNKHRGNSDKAIYTNYHLMIRSTGCDLVHPNDENYSIFKDRSTVIYSLQFCWNCSYFNVPFCYMEIV